MTSDTSLRKQVAVLVDSWRATPVYGRNASNDEMFRGILALISERERLAVVKELQKIFDRYKAVEVHCCWIEDRIAELSAPLKQSKENV